MRNRGLLWITAVAALVISGAVQAADMPLKARPAPAFTWSGCYIGGNLGWARAEHDLSTFALPSPGNNINDAARAAIIGAGAANLSDDSFIGGGQVGCNFQSGLWVWGVEADISVTDLTAGRDTGIVTVAGHSVRSIDNVSVDWLSTFRGRLGVTAGSHVLIYVTGGAAIARVKADKAFAWDFSDLSCPLVSGLRQCHVGATSDTSTGWTVGGGLEWAVGGGWSIKGEYLFVRLGGLSYNTVNPTFLNQVVSHNVGTDLHVARAGLNFKF